MKNNRIKDGQASTREDIAQELLGLLEEAISLADQGGFALCAIKIGEAIDCLGDEANGPHS